MQLQSWSFSDLTSHKFWGGTKIPSKNFSQNKKSSSEQAFLKNCRWVPDSSHREVGKSSHELFEKVRLNAVFFWYFGILGGLLGLYFGVRQRCLSIQSSKLLQTDVQLQMQNCACRRSHFHLQRQICGNVGRKSLITDTDSPLNSN